MQYNSYAQFHPKILLRAMFKLANHLQFRCLMIKKKPAALNNEAFPLPITHIGQDRAQMRVNWHHAVSCLLSPAPIIAAWLLFSQPEGPPAGKLSSTACTTRDRASSTLPQGQFGMAVPAENTLDEIYIWSSSNMYCSALVFLIRLNPPWHSPNLAGTRQERSSPVLKDAGCSVLSPFAPFYVVLHRAALRTYRALFNSSLSWCNIVFYCMKY